MIDTSSLAMGSFSFRFWQSTLGPRLTATQSAVAMLDIALGDSAAGKRTAGSAFPWRHQKRKTPQNALPAGACQQRRLQVDKSAVAVASGSRLNERSESKGKITNLPFPFALITTFPQQDDFLDSR